ncbi:large ribosomal subunit protein eL36B [Monosporozyma servazzii]
MAAKTGIAVGLNKGKQVTAIAPVARMSYKKGASSQRTVFVRSLVKEIAGLAPYERRLIDLIRNSGEKRARKIAKKRLGSFKRAKAKIEEMNEVISASRRH